VAKQLVLWYKTYVVNFILTFISYYMHVVYQ